MANPAPPSYEQLYAADAGPLRRRAPLEVQVYENERWLPVKGWGCKMLPTERKQWSTKEGKEVDVYPGTNPPDGCAWVNDNDWSCDDWMYAVEFSSSAWGQKQVQTSYVRRRMWTRGCTEQGALGARNLDQAGLQNRVKKVQGGYSAVVSWGNGNNRVKRLFNRGGGGSDARAAATFIKIEDKRLFLLKAPRDTKAARTISLASIAEVNKIPALECGEENVMVVTLKPDASPEELPSEPVRIVCANEAMQKQIYNRLRSQRLLANAANTAEGAAAKVGSVLGAGAKVAGHFFAVGLGSGTGHGIGWRLGTKISDKMGL